METERIVQPARLTYESGLVIEPAQRKHARELARIMRPIDMEEVRASADMLPEQAVRASINRSCEAWALSDLRGDFLAVFGIRDAVDHGIPWMLASRLFAQHPRQVWLASKYVIDCYRRRFPLLTNIVYEKHFTAIRWLERLGFRMLAPEKFGARGELFRRFVMRTEELCVTR